MQAPSRLRLRHVLVPGQVTTRRIAGIATAGVMVLSMAACGDDKSDEPQEGAAGAGETSLEIEGVGTVEVDTELTKMLPEGTDEISVGTNAPYPPFIDFVEEGNTEDFKGLDYDIVQAIAARLGVAAPFSQQPFDGLVPGLKAGKYDAVVGGVTDNFERQATATFVDYTASGTGIAVATGNPEGIATLEDLCGRVVAAQKASKQVELLATFSDESCSDPIETTEYPQNTDAVQALLAGKADAIAATRVNLLDDAEKLVGKVEVVDDPAEPNGYQASPNGIGFDKSDAELAKAVQAALQSLMDDGTYDKILAKHGQEAIGIEEATIDAAVD
jgi:polar amino acid transport system substrate-binding protein